MAVVLLNAGGIVGGLVIGRLMDRVNVFGVLAAAFAIGTVFVFALGATLSVSLVTTLALTCATGLTVFGGQLNFPGLTANYYPVHMRSTGAGWAMAVGRIGSVVGPLIGGALLATGFGTRELLCLAALPAGLAAIVLVTMTRLSRDRIPQREGEPQLIEGR
jgi:AAHS family 4-hydroxybenzoate transporter-like MFS transporter